MSEHKANIKWSRDGKDFAYKSYSRDHAWKFPNGVEVPASAAPAYLGNPNCVDPEAAFVAALSSCHMLTFLALACNKGFVVENYEDDAVGHLEKNAAGKMAVTRVELHPKISFSGAKTPAQTDLDWLHDKGSAERGAGTRLRDATAEPIMCASPTRRSMRVSGVRSQRGPLPPYDAHKECFIANSVTTDVRVATT